MKKPVNLPIPVIRTLRKLGVDISSARRRRRMTLDLLAQRAGLSRATISKIEQGDSGTSMGAYAAVLFVLGFVDRLDDIADASRDLLGRELLEEEKLPKRVRIAKKASKDS